MEEQMSIISAKDTGADSTAAAELAFLDSIRPTLEAAVQRAGGRGDAGGLIRFRSGKSYSSVYFHTFMVFRVKMRRGARFFTVPDLFSDLIPADYLTKRMKSEPNLIRLVIDETHPADFYTSFLSEIMEATVNRYPKEWDCCSHYLECSNAKKCIHPDYDISLPCGYRRVLSSGRIFYGENRNMD